MDTLGSKTFKIATCLPVSVFGPTGWCSLEIQERRIFQIAEKFHENQEQVTQTSLNSLFFLFKQVFWSFAKIYSELKPLSYKVYWRSWRYSARVSYYSQDCCLHGSDFCRFGKNYYLLVQIIIILCPTVKYIIHTYHLGTKTFIIPKNFRNHDRQKPVISVLLLKEWSF